MNIPNILLKTDINYPIDNFFANINCINKDFYIQNNLDNLNKNIITISNIEYEFLSKSVSSAIYYLQNLNKYLQNKSVNLSNNVWNICIYSGMFFDLPFTLEDIIFIPHSYLIKSINLNNNNFVITLVHERIHLLQRYNQEIWDAYILENTNWILRQDVYLNKKITYYKTTKVSNPDTTYPNKIFMLKINDHVYWGELIKKDSEPTVYDQWFQIKQSNLPNTFDLYPWMSICKYEHPYEELAYVLSKNLVK